MTTIRALAAELGFRNSYDLRAFADDMLNDIPDDQGEVPAEIESVIREAVEAVNSAADPEPDEYPGMWEPADFAGGWGDEA